MKKICVVIPVCAADEELCRLSIQAGIHFSGAKDFPCLLVTSADNPLANRETLVELLKQCYASVSELIIPDRVHSRRQPWPFAANMAFLRTCQHFAWGMRPAEQAFYYQEADVIPLRRGWMTTLADEYNKCGKPFMGAISVTPDAKGNAGHPHMNGAGFYPSNALLICPEIVTAQETPWDILAGPRIVGECHDVKDKLMIAEFRTSEFYWSQSSREAVGFKQTHITIVNGERVETPVNGMKTLGDCCVWHGCKDRSLYDMLVSPSPAIQPEVVINIPVDVKEEIPYIHPIDKTQPMTEQEHRLAKVLAYAEEKKEVRPKKHRARRNPKAITSDRQDAGDSRRMGVHCPTDGLHGEGSKLQLPDDQGVGSSASK